MYVTKISSVLSPLLLVGLTFGAIGVGGGRSTNPAVVAQEKTPDKGPAKDDKSPESAARKRAEQAELPRAELDLEADHTS